MKDTTPPRGRRSKPRKSADAVNSLKSLCDLPVIEALLAQYDREAAASLRRDEGSKIRFYTTPETENLIARLPDLRRFVSSTKRLLLAQLDTTDVVFHERNGRLAVDVMQLTSDGYVTDSQSFTRARDMQ
jgi:hypothetical protein